MDTAHSTRPKLSVAWWGFTIRFIIAEAVSMITYLLLVLLVGDGGELEIGFARFVVPLVIVTFLWAWMRWVENSSIAVLDLIDWRRFSTGLPGGLALGAVPPVVIWLFLPKGSPDSTEPLGLFMWSLVTAALVMQAFPEEIVFRGWLMEVTKTSPWRSLAWTTIAFTIIHLFSQNGQETVTDYLVVLISPLSFGLLCGALVLYLNNVWWAIGVHTGWHLAHGMFSWAPAAISDKATGAALQLAVAVLYVILAVGVLVLWQRRRGNSKF